VKIGHLDQEPVDTSALATEGMPPETDPPDHEDWSPAPSDVADVISADEAIHAPPERTPVPRLLMPIIGRPLPLASKVLWMLVQRPDLAVDRIEIPTHSELPNIQIVADLFLWTQANPNASTAKLVGYYSGTETGRLLSALLKTEPLVADQDLTREYQDALLNLKKQLVTESLKQLARDATSQSMSARDLHQALTAHRDKK
jgi:DNA primase